MAQSSPAGFLEPVVIPGPFTPRQPTSQAIISEAKLKSYFSITQEALTKAKSALNAQEMAKALDVLDMAQRYYDDAHFFLDKKNDVVLAFAALNYAHGWLDAGARIGLFQANDSRLFAVDETVVHHPTTLKQ